MVFILDAQSLIVLIPCIPLNQGVGVFPVTSVTLSPKTRQEKGFKLPGFVEPHSELCPCQFVLGVTGSWH